MDLVQLLTILNYAGSKNYRSTDDSGHAELAPFIRSAHRAGIKGAYCFSSSSNTELVPEQDVTSEPYGIKPAVVVARADSPEQAKRIHRSVWNIGQIPFLIVLLPNEVRVYTGFEYSHVQEQGLIEKPIQLSVSNKELVRILEDFTAQSIDSGDIWRRRSHDLHPEKRVDRRLLSNLKELGKELYRLGLKKTIASALIGKYVYIRYLVDRKILSDEWLRENNISLNEVLGWSVTTQGLQKFVDILERRFNGNVFPLDFSAADAPTDEHVALVASIFRGDTFVDGDSRQLSLDQEHFSRKTQGPRVRQLHIDFEAYDFQYIPVELLSAIYEQFMHEQGIGRDVGGIYTPEILADYLFSEINSLGIVKPDSRILDPACGSGVFLVLAYRKLIEMELEKRNVDRLRPVELRSILQRSLYGVERVADACYVAEFSLILTMLSYIEPPELHRNKQFQFPRLHNTQIFNCDFFDENSIFWKKALRFDLVIGNPPWFELSKQTETEELVKAWIYKNSRDYAISDNRVSEAFSWRVIDVLEKDGYGALVLPAKTLYNQKATKHRRQFFTRNTVCRITNFSNLRHVLFGGRAVAPAITMVFRKAKPKEVKPPIVHAGPFMINQFTTSHLESHREPWVILINASEIQTVDASAAASGQAVVWKLAMWGTHRDKWALEQIEHLYPTTLEAFIKEKNGAWYMKQGPELHVWQANSGESLPSGWEHIPSLEGQLLLDVDRMNHTGYRLEVPTDLSVFETIPANKCYRRKRGGGHVHTPPPRIIISPAWNYAAYSERQFIIKPRQIEVSAPPEESDYLRALSVYLNTSLVCYYLFFQTADWGIERDRINLANVKRIPLPRFTLDQVVQLADLHREFAMYERRGLSSNENQRQMDKRVAAILGVPEEVLAIAQDFVHVKLTLNEGRVHTIATEHVNEAILITYAQRLQSQLDTFMEGSGFHHKVEVEYTESLVNCKVELLRVDQPVDVKISPVRGSRQLWLDLQELLSVRFSQWVYVQKSLRVFDGPRVSLFKSNRVIDWTETQAFVDADDLIEYILCAEEAQ